MKGPQRFLVGIFAATLGLLWAGHHKVGFAAGPPSTDQPATHNMLVLGKEALYLSHLPMFQEAGKPPMPHRYQAILEVTVAKQEDYTQDRRAHPATTMYTLNPERFVLPELVATDPQHTLLRSFTAKRLFRGHLERDNSVPILENVAVSVKRVIHFREFDPKADKSPQLAYLLFGTGQELFLAHLIAAPPDFDQILAVKVTGHPFTDEELAQGMTVVFPGTENTAASRLKAKQRVAGEMTIGSSAALKNMQVEVDRELYFEEGELRVPPDFESTSEEKQAGFP